MIMLGILILVVAGGAMLLFGIDFLLCYATEEPDK